MESIFCYAYKKAVKLFWIGLLVLIVSCSSPREATEHSVPVEDLPQILRESSQLDQDSANQQTDQVTLNYKNESTDVSIPLDPQGQEFVLELEGVEHTQEEEEEEPDSVAIQDSVVQEHVAERVREVLKNFRRAQDLFYRQDYKGAMERVDKSLELQETADALGLKGTIFFMRDNMSSAKYYWNKAVQMDPEIPVPDIPELETLIRDIKESEDIEEGEE